MSQLANEHNEISSAVEITGGGRMKLIMQYSAAIIAVLSSMFYVFGLVYYETYLSCWGLSESLFPLSKEHSVIYGFFRCLVLGASLLPWLKIVLWGLGVVVVGVIISCYRPVAEFLRGIRSWLRQRVVPVLRNNVVATDAHDRVMNTVDLIFRAIAYVIVMIGIFVLSCNRMTNLAKETALKEHKRILSGEVGDQNFDSRAIIYLKNDTKGFDQYSGHLINTSATHCALYRRGQGVTIFPLANVARMDIRENKPVPQADKPNLTK